jgi:ABC-type nitrate/sulfonate/bicarbonate transport system permease component
VSLAGPDRPLFLADLFQRLPIYLPHLLHDALTALLATLAALVAALVLAQVAVAWRRAGRALSGLAALSQAIPMIAVGPLLVLWFGFGYSTKVLVAALICFYPILVAVMDSAAGLREGAGWSGDNLRLSPFARFRFIYWPCIGSGVGSGIKTTFTLSVIGAILADFILPTRGLGRIINMSRVQYDFTTMYSAVILAALLGAGFYYLGDLSARALHRLVRMTC